MTTKAVRIAVAGAGTIGRRHATIVRATPAAIAASTLTRSSSCTFKKRCIISSTVCVSDTTS